MPVTNVHPDLINAKLAPVGVRLRMLFLNKSIISPLCLVGV